MQQHHTGLLQGNRGVVRDDIPQHIMDFSHHLYPGKTTARDDKGQHLSLDIRVSFKISRFKHLQNMIANGNGIAQGFNGLAMLGHAR